MVHTVLLAIDSMFDVIVKAETDALRCILRCVSGQKRLCQPSWRG
jgi:hypothetical protein